MISFFDTLACSDAQCNNLLNKVSLPVRGSEVPLINRIMKNTSGMQENLGVSINALVKFLVCVGGLVERDVVRDDEGRLGSSGDDQVTEVAVIFLSANGRINTLSYIRWRQGN